MSASTVFRIKQRSVIEFLTLEGCAPLGGDDFLKNIATGDESWFHHYDPENKRQSTEYRHPRFPSVKEFKTVP
jgi:hypothetical protein